ncbi:MAG TPA: acetyl-CoA carboxylase biotin carboxyl carrier protein subunit, partial [Candidatus Competibacter sp.]|nr:acetyl-CoA carboxylase biotin carboxyl carrier protein subunit [Candidatus Competibacter sp.]
MEKKFRITVEGKQYVVAVEDITTDSAQGFYQDMAVVAPPSVIATAPAAAAPAAPQAPAAAGAGDEVAPLGGVV